MSATTQTAQLFGARTARKQAEQCVPPARLSEVAYHGVLGEVVRAIEPQTEAAPEGILLQLLAMMGNLIGRSAHFGVGADTHYLNLFVGIIGRSSRGRKGVSFGVARALLGRLDAAWEGQWSPGLSSGEGLIWAVRDPIYRDKAIKRNGVVVDHEQVLEDAGVADKRLLVTESEFASVLQRMAREGNTLSALMRQAFDGQVLKAMTKGATTCATNPHISIIAHITRDELRRYLQTTETANGLANRFLWCYVDRARLLPDGGVLPELSSFRDALGEAVEFSRAVGLIVRDPYAQRLWHRVYGPLTADRPGILGAVTSRAEALVMRVAALFAVCDRSHVVAVPHLRAALEIWRYCRASAAYIFGDALGDPVADEILRRLQEAYPASLTRTEISDHFGRHRSSVEISRALGLLVDAGMASTEKDATGVGRPIERVCLKPVEDRELSELCELTDSEPPRQPPERLSSGRFEARSTPYFA